MKSYKDSEVVNTRSYFDCFGVLDTISAGTVLGTQERTGCSSELGADLVVSIRADSFLGTVDVEGRHGRVVGRLFGQESDARRL